MSNSTEQTIICLSYFQAKPEYREELIKELLALVEPTRQESGCLQYELVIDNEDPLFLIMVEKFTTLQALEEHEKQPYIVRFVEDFMSLYCEKVTWHVGKIVNP